MEEFRKQAENTLKAKLTKVGLEISPKENGREGVDFIVKSENGKQSEIFLQAMDLIAQQSSKVPKEKLGEPNENLWVALIGFIPEKEPLIFLIPSKTLVKPDGFVFFENNVGLHTYLSNWEIKVFIKGMEQLGEYIIYNQIENFK
ncbi:hypothetical protein EJ994_04450 [Maribacter sp. MJ134]|uniref:hypothetical protein n=1 Tax=Maribacter sp. MJ134 TaxID=2496865 RepID=UPI000F83AB93|nr:hypothetical protein [Maribacter sp. MJ134]AZQ58093.1 hypothetical protein EJ994_04450 [Maribacter sp. MJ134]